MATVDISFASAIDTPLPKPTHFTHIMLDYSHEWCRPEAGVGDQYQQYPDEGIEEWHQRHGLK